MWEKFKGNSSLIVTNATILIVLSQSFSDIPSTLNIPVHLEQKFEVEDDADAVEI